MTNKENKKSRNAVSQDPAQGRQTSQKKRSSLIRLALLMRPHLGKLLLAILCVIAVNSAEILKPFLSKVVIDDFLVGKEQQRGLYSVIGIGVIYFVVAVIGSLLSMTQVRLVTVLSQSILNKLRIDTFEKILFMPMRSIDRHGTGRLITRATNDVETINEFYSDVFINLFRDVFLLIGIVISMLLMDFRLSLVAFTGVPLIVIITFSLKRVIKRNFKNMKTIIGQINGFFAENVAGMRIVQGFNRQMEKLKEFRDLNSAYFRTTKLQVLLNSFLRPTMEVINSAVIALLIAYGYNRMSGGLLEIGVLYAFTDYIKQFFNPINDLAEKYTTVQSALVSTDRIYEILDDNDLEEPFEGKKGGEVVGELEFRNVWFAYEDENWVLKDVSFHVPAGKKAAFIGATGVGKSTIISLVSRYYNVQRGQILVDGVPVEDWKLRDLRRGVCTVLQDVFLFTGTVEENIDMSAGLTQDEIKSALEKSCADEFIKEIGGLSAPVTEQGLNFSTGQRQLFSFARAIAHNPSILVLDEATAHIDTHTETLVTQSLESISKGRTSIFIAHRLSTIRDCDIIFVLHDGAVAEQGTHEELLAANGLYTELIRAQTT
ncbi:MAG: ABC transporter ATP-binding protein [Clostridiales bacterium]|jgi:ATP-binding cassette subfamily B multidrug efflux pump|nr:ABC transporter ATP-binding protein [Clostridiales bacterium]